MILSVFADGVPVELHTASGLEEFDAVDDSGVKLHVVQIRSDRWEIQLKNAIRRTVGHVEEADGFYTATPSTLPDARPGSVHKNFLTAVETVGVESTDPPA